MKHLFIAPFIFLILLSINACSSLGGSSDSTHFYSLSALSESSTSTPSLLKLGIGPVRLQRQLKRPQIVSRINQNELHVDEAHQWAGSLKEDITQVLVDNLSGLLGTEQIEKFPWKSHFRPDYQVRVQVERFDGEPGKEVVLKARWWLRQHHDSYDKLAKKSVIRVAMQRTDYNSYVAALSKALDTLSREIARSIRHQ